MEKNLIQLQNVCGWCSSPSYTAIILWYVFEELNVEQLRRKLIQNNTQCLSKYFSFYKYEFFFYCRWRRHFYTQIFSPHSMLCVVNFILVRNFSNFAINFIFGCSYLTPTVWIENWRSLIKLRRGCTMQYDFESKKCP